MTPLRGSEEITSTKPRWKRLFVFFFTGFAYVVMCFLGPSQYIFHTSMAQYSLFVLKVPLNTNQPNTQTNNAVQL